MMLIGLNTAVYCFDTYCGTTQLFIVQPGRRIVTHLVIKPASLPGLSNRVEKLLPLSHIAEISDVGIGLQCSLNEFCKLPPFKETHFIEIAAPDYRSLEYEFMPSLGNSPILMHVPAIKYNTPPGEIVINRYVQIEAQDGHMGQFEALIILPQTGEITHLVFQRGHMWDRKKETIPASAIDHLEEETIYLKIKKSDLE